MFNALNQINHYRPSILKQIPVSKDNEILSRDHRFEIMRSYLEITSSYPEITIARSYL